MSRHFCAKSLTLLKKASLKSCLPLQTSVRYLTNQDSTQANSFKVLVVWAPEIIPDTAKDNPALVISKGEQEVVKFQDITPAFLHRAFIKNVTLFDAAVEEIISDKSELTPEETMDKLDLALASMKYELSLSHILTYGFPNDYKAGVLDDMYRTCTKHEVNRFNPKTFQVASQLLAQKDINSDLHDLAEFYSNQGKLYGFHLNKSKQDKISYYYENIQKHINNFNKNVYVALQQDTILIGDEHVIKALPETFVTRIFTSTGIRLPLHSVAYETFMTNCPDKLQRHRVWAAYNNKPTIRPGKNNSVEFEKLRDFRHLLAKGLGYPNYAELAMGRRMAGSLQVAKTMIDSIHDKSRKKFEQDLAKLDAEKSRLVPGKIDVWDLPYLKTQVLKKKFGAKLEVSRYFPLNKVISGAFQWVENLFGIKIEEVKSDKTQMWSPFTTFYRVVDDNQVLGHFYFDPFCARTADVYGASIVELTNRSKNLGTIPTCAAFLSKRPPIAKEQEILLAYPEFLSFLSMMGRILTIIMNKRNYYELSTSFNLPKDRLDILGNVLFLQGLYDYKVAEMCSSNIADGKPLPIQTHQMLQERTLAFESIGLTNELFLSALDLALYANTEFWKEITIEVWKKYMAPFEWTNEYAYPLSFVEIISNDGSAGYFSRIWSQMIAADIYSCFKESENSSDVSATGKRYKETILAAGSSMNGAELFRQFRGRDPSVAPFLEFHDLIVKEPTTNTQS